MDVWAVMLLLLLLLRQRVTHGSGQQIDLIPESPARRPARWLSIISWPTPRDAVPLKSMRPSVGPAVSSPYRTTTCDPQISCDSVDQTSVHWSWMRSDYIANSCALTLLTITRCLQAFQRWEQDSYCRNKSTKMDFIVHRPVVWTNYCAMPTP